MCSDLPFSASFAWIIFTIKLKCWITLSCLLIFAWLRNTKLKQYGMQDYVCAEFDTRSLFSHLSAKGEMFFSVHRFWMFQWGRRRTLKGDQAVFLCFKQWPYIKMDSVSPATLTIQKLSQNIVNMSAAARIASCQSLCFTQF